MVHCDSLCCGEGVCGFKAFVMLCMMQREHSRFLVKASKRPIDVLTASKKIKTSSLMKQMSAL